MAAAALVAGGGSEAVMGKQALEFFGKGADSGFIKKITDSSLDKGISNDLFGKILKKTFSTPDDQPGSIKDHNDPVKSFIDTLEHTVKLAKVMEGVVNKKSSITDSMKSLKPSMGASDDKDKKDEEEQSSGLKFKPQFKPRF